MASSLTCLTGAAIVICLGRETGGRSGPEAGEGVGPARIPLQSLQNEKPLQPDVREMCRTRKQAERQRASTTRPWLKS